MSMETNNIYKEDFISAKVKMASSQKDHVELSGNRSPPPRNDLGIEIERLRGNQDLAHTDLLSPSPNKFIFSPPRSMPSPSRRDDFTPLTAPTERGVLPTPDLATSIGHVGSDMETPSTWYEEGLGFEITVLSDIPEFDNFAGVCLSRVISLALEFHFLLIVEDIYCEERVLTFDVSERL